MSEHTHWHVVWDEKVEDRALKVERSDSNTFYRVRADQSTHDEGIAFQDGRDYVHVSPAGKGEAVEGEASSAHALREVLKEMHFSETIVDRVIEHIGDR